MNSNNQRQSQSERDPKKLSFSQAYGYEVPPGPLNLEELPNVARTQIWNVIYDSFRKCLNYVEDYNDYVVRGDWYHILYSKHVNFDYLPIDEWDSFFDSHRKTLRAFIETQPFHKVFDLVQFVMRHDSCPVELVWELKHTFRESQLAYFIDETYPPTILPWATPEEGEAFVSSLGILGNAGLYGCTTHLKKAAELINNRDWAASVRESIHAVESIARQLDPNAGQTLGPALSEIARRGSLHPALRESFTKLYGYTSDEQGIRHALLESDEANVGLEEAVFMLGACASFASYLWRKNLT